MSSGGRGELHKRERETNKAGGRGRGGAEARGGGGRGRGRGRGRAPASERQALRGDDVCAGVAATSLSPAVPGPGGGSDAAADADTNAHAEVLRRRKERFAQDAGGGPGYGLISRGDDLTLKNDAGARERLLEETMQRVRRFLAAPDNDPGERDAIALAFRKLRECVVATGGGGPNGPDGAHRFARTVYMESIDFSVRCGGGGGGALEMYLPALQQAVGHLDAWTFSPAERDYLVGAMGLHLAFAENEVEGALRFLAHAYGVDGPGTNGAAVEAAVEAWAAGDFVAAARHCGACEGALGRFAARFATRAQDLFKAQAGVAYRGREREQFQQHGFWE